MKKLEEGLEWNEKDKQRSKRIWGDEKEVPLEAEPQEGVLLWNTLNINLFLFLLSIFLDFIFLFF